MIGAEYTALLRSSGSCELESKVEDLNLSQKILKSDLKIFKKKKSFFFLFESNQPNSGANLTHLCQHHVTKYRVWRKMSVLFYLIDHNVTMEW